ncbi:MAG: GDSL-type esterase/lipase family protein [Ruminococcus flavefaciens]|nr:GDSL-type esterase/lipase family protein [Ruminococcus flavefaciens]
MIKKIILSLSAMVTVSAVICTAVSASGYTVSDLKNLGDAILGRGEVTEDMDLTGDGVVDSFDLVLMRKNFVSTGDFKEMTFSATEDYVKYTGRNYYDGKTAWLVQSGSAVEFTVNAKSAEVTITGDYSINNDEKYRPRYAVIVDGEIIADVIMSEKTQTVKLFDEETSRTAEVKVIHLSEANNGTIGVSEIKVNSDSPAPVVPAEKKDLTIEFIGDSITCAYGVEGKSAYENFSTTTENFMKSYAYLTAEKLGADYSAVCYSGHGVVSGYSSDGEINTASLVPPYYKNYGNLKDYAKPWDFTKNPNDVVVINLGTNDSSYVDVDLDKRSQEFVDGYVEFLETIRECNPDAYIICTVGIMGAENEYPLIEQAIEIFKEKTGDERVTSYKSPVQNQADGIGADWHPSEITQQKNAYILADKICNALGIESDQIGLDVAQDAEYTLKKDDNAMVSDYFSDWDKSYHITTVTGGTSSESVQAVISEIGMRQNSKYRLSFQIDTADGMEIPFCIRNIKTGEIIFEDVFIGTGGKSLYEKELVDEVADCNAEIIFSIGSADNSRVSLYELRLEKIG